MRFTLDSDLPVSWPVYVTVPDDDDAQLFHPEVLHTSPPECQITICKKSLRGFSPRASCNRSKRKNLTSSRRLCLWLAVGCIILLLCLLLDLWTSDILNNWIRVRHLWSLMESSRGYVLAYSGFQFLLLSGNDNSPLRNVDRKISVVSSVVTASNGSQNATRQLPQAIIIGVKKGGTRALLEFIRLHPQVRAPGAEMHFFDRHYERGLDWYRNQMPLTSPSQITIEKTPSYFVTRDVPERVHQLNPQMTLIIVVRDPITRAISDYTQALSKGRSTRSFYEMAFYSNGTHRLLDTSWGALRIGLYAQHLQNWLKYFPLEQMLFISGEDLIENPAGQLNKVQDFLRLKRLIQPHHFYFDRAKGFPCLRRPEIQLRKCLGKSKGRQHPRIEADVIAQLRDFYKPFNQKFYSMVRQNFHWL